MNFFKEHNILLKIASLLIAISLWSFVVVSENPAKTVKFSGQTVELLGTEQLDARGLMLVVDGDAKVDVSATGKTKDIVNLTAADVHASVDFSDIQEPSTYYMQPSITVPKAESISCKPQRLQFKVEKITTKQVPVRVTTMNDLPSDQRVDKLTPTQSRVTVRGAESMVSTVEYALLTVDLKEISKNMVQTCKVRLYTADDALLDSPYVSAGEDTMDVTVGLNHVVSVPLSVSLISSSELSKDMVTARVEPETIRVYGTKDVVNSLTNLSLGSIDLAAVKNDGEEFTFRIKLPTGVKLVDGEPENAKVKLTMKDDVTRTVSVSSISLNDTSSEEHKLGVTLLTSTLNVQIQGKAQLVAGIVPTDIHAEAKFDSAQLGAGTHSVPVQVTVEQSGVTALSENLTANILIAERKEEDGST